MLKIQGNEIEIQKYQNKYTEKRRVQEKKKLIQIKHEEA